MRYRRRLGALYCAGGSVWLHIGEKVWDVDEIESVLQRRDRPWAVSYELSFGDGATETVSLWLPGSVVLHRLLDFTYDGLDELSDDIMTALPHVAGNGAQALDENIDSWTRRVLPIWQAGFTHSN